MRNITFIIVVLVLAAASKSAIAQQFLYSPEPTHRMNVAFRAFDRPNDGDRLAVAVNANTGRAILVNNDVSELGGGLGPDISYVFSTQTSSQYEIRGYFIQWDNQNVRRGADIFTPGLTEVSFQTFQTNYESQMFSIELNQRNDLTSYFTSILGVRYVSLEEELTVGGDGTLTPPNLPLPVTVSSVTEAKNPMIGLQAGGESRILLTQGISLDTSFRGGVYSNSAKRTNTEGTSLTPVFTRTGSNNDATVMGEFSISLNYDLIPNHASAFIGYDAIYLHGVAIAPRNVGLAPGTGIDDQENIGFNGIRFGLQITN